MDGQCLAEKFRGRWGIVAGQQYPPQDLQSVPERWVVGREVAAANVQYLPGQRFGLIELDGDPQQIGAK